MRESYAQIGDAESLQIWQLVCFNCGPAKNESRRVCETARACRNLKVEEVLERWASLKTVSTAQVLCRAGRLGKGIMDEAWYASGARREGLLAGSTRLWLIA